MASARTLGQFYPTGSPVHALDPRAKVLAVAVLAVGLFFVGSLAGFLAVGAALALCVAASRIPPGVFLGFLRPVLPIVVATAVFQALFSREGEVLFAWGLVAVRDEGLRLAAALALRILLLVGAAGLLTATTSPLALADGVEDLLSPLKKLRVPVHEVAMMMSLTLRFFPTLADEAGRITKAQAARGADFSEGGPFRRARAMLPVLVPLTVGAFRRADELAEAMESRGYRGGEGRTRYRELRFGPRDWLAPVLAAVVVAAAVSL